MTLPETPSQVSAICIWTRGVAFVFSSPWGFFLLWISLSVHWTWVSYWQRSVTLSSGDQHCSFCPAVYFHLPGASGKAGLVCMKPQPWIWGITAVGESLLQGFTAAGVYHLAVPYTQQRFAWKYFPNDTSDMGDLACGMPFWRPAAQHQLQSFTWSLFTTPV